MHIWKPAARGFAARVSPVSPRNRARPAHSGEKSPSRGVASLDPHLTPRGRAEERRRRRLISSDDLAMAASPPPASLHDLLVCIRWFPLPSPPLPSPRISLPVLGFLLSSPHTFFLWILLKQSKTRTWCSERALPLPSPSRLATCSR